MSKRWTYQELADKVKNDLDMQEEMIVTAAELIGYCNAAIEEAEAEIVTIYEDYFLTHYSVPLIQGTSSYELPEGIYIEKIRGVTYCNGTNIYDVKRFKTKHGSSKFLQIKVAQQNAASGDDYRYYLENPSVTDGYLFKIVPASRETSSTVMEINYIREAARIVEESDVLDIPQFAQFVIEFMKGMCKAKENGGQMPPDAVTMIEQKRGLMVNTLTRMVIDDDDLMEADLTPYEEMS